MTRQSLFIYLLLFLSCEKVNYYPDRPTNFTKTKILAHRGSGDAKIQENSLEASVYGLSRLDGIEIDLQISKERTIWLAHDPDLPKCDNLDLKCYSISTDSEIEDLDSCQEYFTYTRLEEVFKIMVESYPDKYISLDVKAWAPCKAIKFNTIRQLNIVAEQIIQLTNKYHLNDRVLVECETATFLNYIRNNSNGIETYLTVLGDFERGMLICLENGYSGISFKYKFKETITVDHIQLLRKKGKKIQIWTTNSETDILEALSLKPDFIQTDNINYFSK